MLSVMALNTLVIMARLGIAVFNEWANENFRFILRIVSAPIIHMICVVICPFAFVTNVQMAGSILVFISAGIALIEVIMKAIFWRKNHH